MTNGSLIGLVVLFFHVVVAPVAIVHALLYKRDYRSALGWIGVPTSGMIEAFQAIADANGGTRVSGTSGFDASRDYVARKLRGAGYDVTIQNFDFKEFWQYARAEDLDDFTRMMLTVYVPPPLFVACNQMLTRPYRQSSPDAVDHFLQGDTTIPVRNTGSCTGA
jgi:hypothetical protein